MTGRRRVACPDCGEECDAQGIGAHRRHRHGRVTGGHRERTDRRVYAGPGPYPCPECDHQPFSTPQGLGAHRFRSHGVIGSSAQAAYLVRRRERRAMQRAEAAAVAALFDGIVTVFEPTGLPCCRRRADRARLLGVLVWVADCDCGYRAVGRLRYEVVDALLDHPSLHRP